MGIEPQLAINHGSQGKLRSSLEAVWFHERFWHLALAHTVHIAEILAKQQLSRYERTGHDKDTISYMTPLQF